MGNRTKATVAIIATVFTGMVVLVLSYGLSQWMGEAAQPYLADQYEALGNLSIGLREVLLGVGVCAFCIICGLGTARVLWAVANRIEADIPNLQTNHNIRLASPLRVDVTHQLEDHDYIQPESKPVEIKPALDSIPATG